MSKGKPESKRKRGAQPDNRNALKHGFYSKSLSEAEKLELEVARSIEGIDDEIAILRVKILAVLAKDPNNIQLLLDASETLARLVKLRYGLSAHDGHRLQDSIVKVLKELGGPIIGSAIGTVISK